MSRRRIKRKSIGLRRYDMSSVLGPEATAMTAEEVAEAINAGLLPGFHGTAAVVRGGVAIKPDPAALAEVALELGKPGGDG
jgi:hypothetical protein